MRPIVDSHRHFTGGLPSWFICGEANRRIEESHVADAVRKLVGSDKLTPRTLRASFKRAFQAPSPYLAFFETYGLIQDITKPREENHDDFYFRAGRALAEQARREGTRMELIIGVQKDLDLLMRRIRNTLLGAESTGKQAVIKAIRLTFIRSPNGNFKNLSPSLVETLFELLEKKPDIDRIISGVDFCGAEFPREPGKILDTIDQVYVYNRYRISRRRNKLAISVHAGEDFSYSNPADQLCFMEEIFTRTHRPQTIAHGTLLWIPSENFHLERDQLRQREECLRMMSRQGISLEICPTANLRMTPLRRRRDIPVLQLTRCGIRVKIGSDNPVLLRTTIRRELKYLLAE